MNRDDEGVLCVPETADVYIHQRRRPKIVNTSVLASGNPRPKSALQSAPRKGRCSQQNLSFFQALLLLLDCIVLNRYSRSFYLYNLSYVIRYFSSNVFFVE